MSCNVGGRRRNAGRENLHEAGLTDGVDVGSVAVVSDRKYADRAEVFDTYERHVSAGKVRFYKSVDLDVVMGAREGATFSDRFDDRRWYNCHCNGGVFNLGHRNPEVLAAVARALSSVDVGNHHLVSDARARLAERLAATTGGALPGIIFGVSGGEAVDVAIKVARGVTRRTGIVSAVGGYHGHTAFALAAGDPQYRAPFGPNLPGFVQVPFDDVAAMDSAVDDTTAAVILEPIPATLGMPIPAEDYVPAVRRLCDERGAKLILDEVQTGLGRTGRFWCHDHWGVRPDIIVTGKGLSGGIYPITATLLAPDLYAFFDDHPFIHVSTFGGAEPGCAAGLAVLDQVEAPGFLDRVTKLSERFAAGLQGMPFELRRLGLMMSFAFEPKDAGIMASKMLYDAGVFTIYANNDTRVLQFLPSLILSDDEADEIIRRVRKTFGG